MGSNCFGTLFKITTWGESHGRAIGVVIDGCPAGLELSECDIDQELARRQPGMSLYTSPRKEPDKAEILSGLFEGRTTGAPISILIFNRDVDTSKYEPIKELLRPGHATFSYLEKYGVFDYRGASRASARETACRVAAGAVAKKLLKHSSIELVAYIKAVDTITAEIEEKELSLLRESVYNSPVFCPHPPSAVAMMQHIETVRTNGDSVGGIVELISSPLPVGLGDPIYEKLEAKLAHAMLSLPASKGFECGEGFRAAQMRGSQHNDLFTVNEQGKTVLKSNRAGGTLGGISNGMPLICRVAFKPTSSILQSQETIDTHGQPKTLELPAGSRHDPCVALRAVPVVEAMGALVLADLLLMNRIARL